MDSAQPKATATKRATALGKVIAPCAATLATLACATTALAGDVTPFTAPPSPADADRYYAYNPAKASAPTRAHRTFGVSMDVGVPDGAALGVLVRPRFDWLRLGAAVTHNGIAPGVRLGVTIDPIAFPIAPTFTIEGGHCWAGTVPGLSGSPSIGYDYANFHLGIEIGKRATFRFFLRGGASWVDMNAAQAQNTTSNGSTIGNPSYRGWVAPSAKLGFALYF